MFTGGFVQLTRENFQNKASKTSFPFLFAMPLFPVFLSNDLISEALQQKIEFDFYPKQDQQIRAFY